MWEEVYTQVQVGEFMVLISQSAHAHWLNNNKALKGHHFPVVFVFAAPV